MTTSQSVDFSLNAGEVVSEAFKLLGIRSAETPLEAFEIQDGLTQLNLMMKGWQAQGLHLWSQEEGVLFLDVGETDYLLGPGGDKATTLDDFVDTTSTSDAAISDTTIPLTSVTGMALGDNIGIQTDSKTREWFTIVSISSLTVTLSGSLTVAASSGNSVFTFTNLIERPLRVLSSRRKSHGSDNEIEINQWSRSEYFNQVNKTSQGTVVNAYYSPLLTNGRFYVWQTASSVNDYVRISFERTIHDIDDSTNTLDIPVEWLETVIYNLASRLADTYSVPMSKVQTVVSKASYFLDELIGFDEELSSVIIQPDFS